MTMLRNATGCLAAVVLAAACTPDEPPPEPAPTPAVAAEGSAAAPAVEEPDVEVVVRRLIVEPETVLMAQNGSVALSATALGEEGTPVDVDITFRSLSPSRLAVDADGVISSVGARGPGFVTASVGEHIVEIPVRVVSPEELPAPEPDEGDEGSGENEPVVIVRGADAPAVVPILTVRSELVGSWSTRQIDGRERIVTFHTDGRLLDERRGERWIGRWQVQEHERTQILVGLTYDEARHGSDAMVCEPPEGGVLRCGDRAFTRRSR